MGGNEGRSVTITRDGRSGTLIYREAAGQLSFYWEFGGGDAFAIVQAGSRDEWKKHHPWAAARRTEILRFVAAETVRQEAPGCRPEVDERTGNIILRQGASPPVAAAPADVAWYYRLRTLRLKFALVVLAVTLGVAGILGVKNSVLQIDPGKGAPFGLSVRTDKHIATLIQNLEPYTPSLNRDHGKDRYTISVFVVPLDGSEPWLEPVAEGMAPNQFALAKILGSDGRALWIDVGSLSTADLSSHEVQASAGPVPNDLQGAQALPFPPEPDRFLSAGFLAGPNEWYGLLSAAELESSYQPKKFVRRVVPAIDAREMRRFYRGALEPDSSGTYFQILSMTALGDAEYFNAAFLRIDDQSEPLRLTDPDGALMLYTSAPGLKGTAMIARVDPEGTIAWNVDTGIDRFSLTQILPGTDAMAFVGTRPREEGKVPEPLLVIVQNATGDFKTHSLWQ